MKHAAIGQLHLDRVGPGLNRLNSGEKFLSAIRAFGKAAHKRSDEHRVRNVVPEGRVSDLGGVKLRVGSPQKTARIVDEIDAAQRRHIGLRQRPNAEPLEKAQCRLEERERTRVERRLGGGGWRADQAHTEASSGQGDGCGKASGARAGNQAIPGIGMVRHGLL